MASVVDCCPGILECGAAEQGEMVETADLSRAEKCVFSARQAPTPEGLFAA